MARPLRIVIEDGRYHLMNRGIERRSIFRSAADSRRFLQLLVQLPNRFGLLIHCCALVSHAAVAQAVSKAEYRIAHSVATRKLYHQLCTTFKLKT